MSKITKEAATAAMFRFVLENNRYPTKYDYKNVDYLYSPETSRRLIGNLRELTMLEDFYNEFPQCCPECGGPISYAAKDTNRFCSSSCAAKYNNKRKDRQVKSLSIDAESGAKEYILVSRLETPFNDCLHCGKKVASRKSIYCSTSCSSSHRHHVGMQKWLDGGGDFNENKTIRKFLIALHGNSCSVCGITDWNGKSITFEVEHIDGNSEDSSPSNVCLICPNCHSQTDTYKGKNKGRGRHSRRQRYQDGKSY